VLAGVFVGTAAALRFSDASYLTPQGVVGMPYSHRFEGVGGCGPTLPYRFTVINGSLPPGLSLAADGLLSGTPTAHGSFSFWINLNDEDPPSLAWCHPGSSQREFTVTVLAAELVITTRRLPTGKVGRPFETLIATRGGVEPLEWQIVDGSLPLGLALAPRTGAVVGRPKEGGRFRMTFEATDRLGTTRTRTAVLVVDKMTIATRRLPSGTVGRAYRARLATRNGATPVRWRVMRGPLPRGLRLEARTGTVAGTPRSSADLRVMFRARDRYGDVSKRTVRLVIGGGSTRG